MLQSSLAEAMGECCGSCQRKISSCTRRIVKPSATATESLNMDLKDHNMGKENSSSVVEEKIHTSYWDWRSEENMPYDFCKYTSLHGLKYIGERKQHIVERVFWSAAFAVGLVMSYYMISDVWVKYKHNSVIVTFEPSETKIEKLPFPAVTICNMNKVLKSKAEQIIKDAKGDPKKETTRDARENLYYLNHVCSSSKSFTKRFNYSAERGNIDKSSLHLSNKDEDKYDGDKYNLLEFFKKASPLCQNMIPLCVWAEQIVNCSEFFRPIETDYGKCCTFNMLPPSILHRINTSEVDEDPNEEWEWDEDSFSKTQKGKNFPRRQKLAGKSFGLSILLNPDLDEYFCTTSDSIGFRIVTHLPIDVPQVADFGSAIKPNSEVFVNVRPDVTVAKWETIGKFNLAQRECYFSTEAGLGYYQYYSATNCIDECIANITYKDCNCTRHYMPRDDSKPLCGPKEFLCASKIKEKVALLKRSSSVQDENVQVCDKCIPTCNEISYHTETTYTPLQDAKLLWMGKDGKIAKWAYDNVSIVHIYFGEDSTNAKLRKELYGVIDLIANFGGLMGLCLGFSGLSLVEVLYFLTLRVWCRQGINNPSDEKTVTKPFTRSNSASENDVPKLNVFNRKRQDLTNILYSVNLAQGLNTLPNSGCLTIGCSDVNHITPLESRKQYSMIV